MTATVLKHPVYAHTGWQKVTIPNYLLKANQNFNTWHNRYQSYNYKFLCINR